MSLRYYLYSAVDTNNQPLILVVYSSTDTQKIFVLCHQDQKATTLHLLHYIEHVISTVFDPETQMIYVPKTDGKPVSIPGYLRIDQKFTTYYDSFIDFTTTTAATINLTTTTPYTTSHYQRTEPNKRHHTGEPKAHVH